jgi:hypothetical protein
MKKLAWVLLAATLLMPLPSIAEPAASPAKAAAEPADAPVRVQVTGLSKDRRSIDYKVTVFTHKPIRSVELGVSAYSEEGYIGALSLRWPSGRYRNLGWGRTSEASLKILQKPLPANDTLTVERGVLQVIYADGTTWTSAGKYAGTSR